MPPPEQRRLPPELLLQIFSYLDESYVERHLEDDPTTVYDQHGGFKASDASFGLKNASLVCQQWHALTRPLLFRHLFLLSEDWDTEPGTLCESINKAIMYIELNQSSLQRVVRSVTLFISSSGRKPSKSGTITRWLRDSSQSHGTGTNPDVLGLNDVNKPLLDALSTLTPSRVTIIGCKPVAAEFMLNRFTITDHGPSPASMVESTSDQLFRHHARQTKHHGGLRVLNFASPKEPSDHRRHWTNSPIPLQRIIGMGHWESITFTYPPNNTIPPHLQENYPPRGKVRPGMVTELKGPFKGQPPRSVDRPVDKVGPFSVRIGRKGSRKGEMLLESTHGRWEEWETYYEFGGLVTLRAVEEWDIAWIYQFTP